MSIMIGRCATSRRFLSLGLGLAGVLAFGAARAAAAPYYWDNDGDATGNNVDGTGLGGAGTITTAGVKWWDGSAASDVAASALPASTTLTFTGPGGAITVTTGVKSTNVVGVDIKSDGYSFVNTVGFGCSSLTNLTLDDGTASAIMATVPSASFVTNAGKTITVGDNDTLTLNSVVSSGAFTKSGNGTLFYANTTATVYSRSVVINAGTVKIKSMLTFVFGGVTT